MINLLRKKNKKFSNLSDIFTEVKTSLVEGGKIVERKVKKFVNKAVETAYLSSMFLQITGIATAFAGIVGAVLYENDISFWTMSAGFTMYATGAVLDVAKAYASLKNDYKHNTGIFKKAREDDNKIINGIKNEKDNLQVNEKVSNKEIEPAFAKKVEDQDLTSLKEVVMGDAHVVMTTKGNEKE